jgi:hypothetical protein
MATAIQTEIFEVHFANGDPNRLYADSEAQAVQIVKARFGADVAIGNTWEVTGSASDYDGRMISRKRVWLSDADRISFQLDGSPAPIAALVCIS